MSFTASGCEMHHDSGHSPGCRPLACKKVPMAPSDIRTSPCAIRFRMLFMTKFSFDDLVLLLVECCDLRFDSFCVATACRVADCDLFRIAHEARKVKLPPIEWRLPDIIGNLRENQLPTVSAAPFSRLRRSAAKLGN